MHIKSCKSILDPLGNDPSQSFVLLQQVSVVALEFLDINSSRGIVEIVLMLLLDADVLLHLLPQILLEQTLLFLDQLYLSS